MSRARRAGKRKGARHARRGGPAISEEGAAAVISHLRHLWAAGGGKYKLWKRLGGALRGGGEREGSRYEQLLAILSFLAGLGKVKRN